MRLNLAGRGSRDGSLHKGALEKRYWVSHDLYEIFPLLFAAIRCDQTCW